MKTSVNIRVFVDAHVFDGRFQGTRTFIRGVYTIMAQKAGIQLYLAASDIDNLKKNFSGENIVFIKYNSNSSFTRLGYEIPALIRKHKIDYAHFQYIVPAIKNCKFIVTTHDVIFNEYPDEFSYSYRIAKNLLYRMSALRADILTTVSQYSKQSISKYLGIRSKEIHITPNGIEDKFFSDYNKVEAKKLIAEKYGLGKFILFVSRIEPRKNHILLLKAFLDLKLYLKGYNLVLLGHETLPVPEFDSLFDVLPDDIRRFIYINGDVNDEDLLQFYLSAEVFVYPSKAEGFGIPPLEAAALKTPVLCSNNSAMSDFIFFGRNHVDPLDPEIFKKRLEDMLESPDDQNQLSRISEIIHEKYSWNQSAEKLYQIIIK